MKTYHCKFHGKLAGAIGISYAHIVTVQAETPEAANLKLYDTHDHIMHLEITEVKPEVRNDD